ncbi:MAG: serine/threonine-protein kinase, partial [Gemmatimonadales bacterium]|nr:serine/threonine-protein kinase [Gemmatimonadales bacterium]
VQGFLYYVMPFVEGESLAERISREGRLPVSDTVRILREVADALAYSHERGVVHRDIKPGNVMLTSRHAVVTDFGVAKAVTASSGDNTTTVGMAVGTPHYMAPEQAMGQGDIDARADIYALGVLGYEMLAGHPPFTGGTPQQVLSSHVMEVPKDIRELRPGTPAVLADVIMRCLAKDPADRWQRADDVVQQLEMVAATPSGGLTPTHTRPVSAVTPPPTRRAWLGILAAVVLAVSGGVGIWSIMRDSGGAGTGQIERIAVLPIEDLSGQDGQFVVAMHDALSNALARVGAVDVAPRSATLRYADGGTPNSQIADELKVDAVVEATVFRAGSTMRINVQFSDPRTTRSLWSESISRDVTDVLAAQDDIVQQITRGVQSVLVGTPVAQASPGDS